MNRAKFFAVLVLALGTVFAPPARAQEILPFAPEPSVSIAGRTMQESVYSPHLRSAYYTRLEGNEGRGQNDRRDTVRRTCSSTLERAVTRPAAVRSLEAQREPPAPINPDY